MSSNGNAREKCRLHKMVTPLGMYKRVKLELELREMWRLIGRLVDTPLYVSLYDWVLITR